MTVRLWTVFWASGCVTWTCSAFADANACATAYERAQEQRAERHFREALETLKACVAPVCSEFVRTECSRWLTEVEASLPTIVLAARTGDNDLQDVQVFCDDTPLTDKLDGRAVAIDPGPHTLTFRADRAKPVTLKLVFREGEKNRLVTASLGEPKRVPPPTPLREPETASPQPSRTAWPMYAFGGLGILGIGGFVALGLSGNSALSDRENTCAPTCTDSEVRSVRTKYYLADVSLGVGVLSLGVAGYLLLTAPRDASRTTGNVAQHFDVRLNTNGGYALLGGRF